MTKLDRAGLSPSLLVAIAALAIVLVHTIAYVAADGVGSRYATAMSATGHDGYWPILVAAVVGAVMISVVAVRARVKFARSVRTASLSARLLIVLRVWLTLAISSLVGFVLLENVEGWVTHGSIVGLAPVALVGRMTALGPTAIVITALALAAVAVMYVRRVEYARVLNQSYARLVTDGVYTADFRQAPWAVTFVDTVLGGTLDEVDGADPVRVLECGCGTGVWLEELDAIGRRNARPLALFGFDLSPDMAGAARARLTHEGVAAEIRVGDIFDPASYAFGVGDRHAIVMAYDVVQQLPADAQGSAVDAMLEHVEAGGALVVFDHDAKTRYGRVMGTKKWLRRYLGVPLVPRFYIHARYPDLKRMARRLREQGSDARIVVEPQGRKRALVVRKPRT
jgi:SAM-dependent methyltransferase